MADFDLSLVVRGVDQGASATGTKLENTIDGIAASQTRAAATADKLAGATTRGAGAADKSATAAAREDAAVSAAAAAKDRASLAAVRLGAAQERQAAQTAKAEAAARRLGAGLGAARSNMSGFGAQFADVSQTLALGINPFTVLLQQGNQVAMSLQGMRGAAGTVASFFAGPLGSVLIATTGILGMLAFSGRKAKDSQKELGDGMDFAKMSANELIKSIDQLEAAQRKQIRTSYDSEQASYADATAALASARAKREQAKATLEEVIARAKNAPQGFSEAATSIRGGLNAQASAARDQLAELDASIGTAIQLEKLAKVPILQREIKAATDETAAATNRFDKALFTLTRRYLDLGTISEKEFKAESIRLTKRLEAEKKVIQERERKKSPAFDGKTLDSFGSPIPGAPITSGFGSRVAPIAGASTNHLALDYGAKLGTAILAAADGVVKRAGTAGGYGNQLQINHGGGTQTRYSHLSKFDVAEGDRVTKGQVIGRVGATGTATAAHLHYEVLVNGKKVDPRGGRFPFDPAEVEDAAEKAADALASFGSKSGESIDRISASFDKQPRLIDRAAQSTRELDALIKELGDRKPPDFKALIADAERAKVVVAEGVNRPYEDFIASQQQALQVQRLITAGRNDEAEALRVVFDLERQMGPLVPARKAAVLATVEALRAEGKALDLNREKQQRYLDQLSSVKDAVRDVFRDPMENLKDLPKRLIAAATQFKADEFFEKIFGDTFRKIEDKITGADAATQAAERFGETVDGVSSSAKRLTSAFDDVAAAARRGPVDPLAPLPDPQTAANDNQDPIVVVGKRLQGMPEILAKLAKGIGINDASAKKIGQYAIQGMVVAQGVGNVIQALRGNGGGPGGRVGNAIHAALDTAGQLDPRIGAAVALSRSISSVFTKKEFAGGLFGVVGNVLFGKKPPVEKGSSIVTSVDDVTQRHSRVATSGLGRSVASGVAGIAETLGGGTAGFNVGIGVREGKFVVDTTGRGDTKGPNVRSFESEAEAISFAIADAIKDGAITGLSSAVKAALTSGGDIDTALREAVKVDQLETLIGGLGARLTDEFQRFDALAKERVRLAKKYGLDVIAVEKINAEERLKLVENLITSRIGGLQDFKKSMAFGELFEGDAATRRTSILGEIDTVQKQAEAGVDGAADKLADLYSTLINTSKEAFGTAGPELSADRALATSGVDRVIAMEQARIDQAKAYQDSTLAAANQNNALTNETNNILAQIVAITERAVQFGGGGGNYSTAPNVVDVSRFSKLGAL